MKKQLIPRNDKKVNCMDYISKNCRIEYLEIMKNRRNLSI